MTGPNPADYGRFPGDAEFINSIQDHPELSGWPADMRYDAAKRTGLLDKHRARSGAGAHRPLVNLPEADVQLGTRWRHLLTHEQLQQAVERGQFGHLAAGFDPDVTPPAAPGAGE